MGRYPVSVSRLLTPKTLEDNVAMNHHVARYVTDCLLDESFIRRTISDIVGEEHITFVSNVDAKLIQGGEQYTVWKVGVNARNKIDFILNISMGQEWNESVMKEFEGLFMLDKAAKKRRMEVSISTYESTFIDGSLGEVAAFSAQYLTGKFGVYPQVAPHTILRAKLRNGRIALYPLTYVQYCFNSENGYVYPMATDAEMIDIGEYANMFTAALWFAGEGAKRSASWRQSKIHQASDRMTYQVVSLLRKVNLLTGQVPSYFLMNKGDIVGIDDRTDYGLRICCLREGLMELDPGYFREWLFSIPTYADLTWMQAHYPEVQVEDAVAYPLFKKTNQTVEKAIVDTDRLFYKR